MPDLPPTLLSIHDDYIARLRAREQQAAASLVSAYADALQGVQQAINDLDAKVQVAIAKGQLSPAWAFQRDRLANIEQQVAQQIAKFAAYAAYAIPANQAAVVQLAQQMAQGTSLAGLGSSPAGVKMVWTKLNTRAMEDLVGFTADGSPVKQLLDELPGIAGAAVRQIIAKGIAQGINPRGMAKEIDQATSVPLVRALRISRTETMRSYNEAALRSYRANADVVDGWVWIASLSPRTCPVCLAMHGTVHPLSEAFASHVSCRCTSAPVTKSWEDILGDAGKDIPDHVAAARVQHGDGQEWLERQPEPIQVQVLGQGKQSLFAHGLLGLDDLVGYKVSQTWGPSRFERTLKEIQAEVNRDGYASPNMTAIYPHPLPGAWTAPAAATVTAPEQLAVAEPVDDIEEVASQPDRRAAASRNTGDDDTDDIPPPAPEPVQIDWADVILGGQKTGAAQGSNAGGFYTGKDGIKRYVKFYSDPAQAYGEQLANEIYRGLGLQAPMSTVFTTADGQIAYASEIVEGVKGTLGNVGITPVLAQKFLKGFAADVLTGNWDAVGLTQDNALVMKSGNGVLRVDNGGTFLFRAQGGRKPAFLLDQITEWEKLLDPSINPAYYKVAEKAGVQKAEDMGWALVNQIKKIEQFEQAEGGWAAFVERIAGSLDADDKAAMVQMLDSRTAQLTAKRKALQKALNAISTAAKKAAMAAVDTQPVTASLTPDPAAFVPLDMENDPKLRAFVDGLSSKSLGQLDASYYDEWFGDRKLKEDVRSQVGSWTGEYRKGKFHQKIYAAWDKLLNGGKPSTDFERSLAKIIATRADRWERAAERIGIRAPSHFHAFRGVNFDSSGGDDMLKWILAAWQNEDQPLMMFKQESLASWGLTRSAADKFSSTSNGAIFETWIPIEQTYADKIADDGNFITVFSSEQEVIAGGPGRDAVVVPKNGVTVWFKGKQYGYAQRAELFAAYQQRFGSLPDASDFGLTTVLPALPGK